LPDFKENIMTDSFCFTCRSTIAFGTGALSHMPFDLAGMSVCKPFVITSPQACDAGLHLDLAAAFTDSDMPLGIATLSDDIFPDTRDIETLYQLFVDKGHDGILALGTGPVVQTAKILNLALCLGPEIVRSGAGSQKIITPLMPLAVIPTGPSDGRETSTIAVCASGRFVSEYLMPDQVVITADTMLGAPENQVLAAGWTCLAVCCNAFVFSKNPLIHAHAALGIGLLTDVLPFLVKHNGLGALRCQKAPKNRRLPLARLTHAAALTGMIRANTPEMTPLHDADEKSGQTDSGQNAIQTLIHLFETSLPDAFRLGNLLLPLTDPDRYTSVPGHRRPEAAIQAIQQFVQDLSRTMPQENSHGNT
jgi:alcohol dehydrogenase class IV